MFSYSMDNDIIFNLIRFCQHCHYLLDIGICHILDVEHLLERRVICSCGLASDFIINNLVTINKSFFTQSNYHLQKLIDAHIYCECKDNKLIVARDKASPYLCNDCLKPYYTPLMEHSPIRSTIFAFRHVQESLIGDPANRVIEPLEPMKPTKERALPMLEPNIDVDFNHFGSSLFNQHYKLRLALVA